MHTGDEPMRDNSCRLLVSLRPCRIGQERSPVVDSAHALHRFFYQPLCYSRRDSSSYDIISFEMSHAGPSGISPRKPLSAKAKRRWEKLAADKEKLAQIRANVKASESFDYSVSIPASKLIRRTSLLHGAVADLIYRLRAM